MTGIVAGPQIPARVECEPCGGKPLSVYERQQPKVKRKSA